MGKKFEEKYQSRRREERQDNADALVGFLGMAVAGSLIVGMLCGVVWIILNRP